MITSKPMGFLKMSNSVQGWVGPASPGFMGWECLSSGGIWGGPTVTLRPISWCPMLGKSSCPVGWKGTVVVILDEVKATTAAAGILPLLSLNFKSLKVNLSVNLFNWIRLLKSNLYLFIYFLPCHSIAFWCFCESCFMEDGVVLIEVFCLIGFA